MVLVYSCLAMANCAPKAVPGGSAPDDVLPVAVQNGEIGRHLLGRAPDTKPLNPEPGDIWAGVLPTDPPAALTPPPSRRTAGGPEPMAGVGAPRGPVTDQAVSADDISAVHLVTADSAEAAALAWKQLQQRLPDLMRGRSPHVEATDVDGRTVWRLAAAGFATDADARAFCSRMQAAKVHCRVVRTAAAQ